MTLLDQVLDSTQAEVVGEQHDINAINFVAGLSDPGEMIRCGYLPQIRRLHGEADQAYADRIRPIVMALPKHERDVIMTAAIRRAGLDQSNGRVNVMVAVGRDKSRLPWHALGTFVAEAVNSADAMRLSGTNWRVKKVPAEWTWNGTTMHSRESFLIIREDTGAELGRTGKVYQTIQNETGFDFVDTVLADYGARYETAGSINGGRQVWLQAHLPQQRMEVQRGDVVESYAMFTLSHDGRSAVRCFPTTERVVCANTFRIATGKASSKGISIRHTGDVKSKINDAKRALGISVRACEEFKAAAESMVRKPLPIIPFANDVLDVVLDITAADAAQGAGPLAKAISTTQAGYDLAFKTFDKAIQRRGKLLADILDRYESDRCQPRGTAWAAFNAVTEHADHNKIGKRNGRNAEDRRFESVLTGRADEMKQVAYELAIK